MADIQQLTWQTSLAENWQDRVAHGRLPHAVLLTGSKGVGKRSAAAWIAQRHLGISETPLPVYPVPLLEHSDMRWISPPDGKQAIGIDQIRELVAEMSMTSYQGGGKAAVIDPADAMTNNAANSLLKTLEEPSGDALLILIADRKGRLPATIFSRCQRIDVPAPTEADALQWLDRRHPGSNWAGGFTPGGQCTACSYRCSGAARYPRCDESRIRGCCKWQFVTDRSCCTLEGTGHRVRP